MNTRKYIYQIKNSILFKDSFWAVAGNGFGNVLLLFAGILIARFLGKDVYGIYGIAKSTMFQVACFSTFGLGYSSTKFIAQYATSDTSKLKSIAICAIKITIIFSLIIGILTFCFSGLFATYVNNPDMKNVFRFISVLIVFRSLSTVCAGILAGFKLFKRLAINNIVSGFVMVIISVPLAYHLQLGGAMVALAISQIVLSILNITSVSKIIKSLHEQSDESSTYSLLKFSLPVAIQELSYSIFIWSSNLIMAKYASLGEVGIYSACSQWNAVVLMIPNLLYNVVLSYLSGTSVNKEHSKLLYRMIVINFICALIPFIIIVILSPIIVSFYGTSFLGMQKVLNILILSTVFYSCANVFYSDLLSINKGWVLCITKTARDVITIIALYVTLTNTNGINAAINYAIINVLSAILFLATLAIICFHAERRQVAI